MSTVDPIKLNQLARARMPREKKKPAPIARQSEKKKAQAAEEKKLLELDKAFYLEVWLASPHICQCGCGQNLGREPLTTFFHHLLEKRNYPEFRHTPENIMILHPDCHNAVESNIDNRASVRLRREGVYKQLIG